MIKEHLLKSDQWHHPSSARQPHFSARIVPSESHRFLFDNILIFVDPLHSISSQSVSVLIVAFLLSSLNSNQLTGTIPLELGNFTQLGTLYL